MILWTSLLLGIGCLVLGGRLRPQSQLSTVKQWNLLTYNFEWNASVTDKDFYNPERVIATGIAVGTNRIFVATPRLFSGVPATVSAVSRKQLGDSPVLEAYPKWSFHTAASLRNYNCSDLGLVSVYRVRIDSCNRLWALDAGVSRSFEDYEITCAPKILVFDLTTDEVVRRIDFPRDVVKSDTLFTNLIIDESTSKPENNCDDVFVYISDTVEPGLVIYDGVRDLTWRVSHPSMYPNPDFAESRIHEDKFVLMDGIVGLGMDSKAGILYYQPLATNQLFSVSTKVLRSGPVPQDQALPVKLVGRKSSQGITLGVSKDDGSILFSPLTETAVASWNPFTNDQKVLAYDPEALQFVADISLTSSDPSGIYILSSRFHKYFLKNLDRNAINVRILRIGVTNYKTTSQEVVPTFYTSGYRASREQFSTTPYPFAYNNDYFRSAGQSFQYEAPRYNNDGLTNFFTSPSIFPSISYSTFGQSPYGNDFINLHYRKRAPLNSKAAH